MAFELFDLDRDEHLNKEEFTLLLKALDVLDESADDDGVQPDTAGHSGHKNPKVFSVENIIMRRHKEAEQEEDAVAEIMELCARHPKKGGDAKRSAVHDATQDPLPIPGAPLSPRRIN